MNMLNVRKRTSAQNNVYRTVYGSEAKYSSIVKGGVPPELVSWDVPLVPPSQVPMPMLLHYWPAHVD